MVLGSCVWCVVCRDLSVCILLGFGALERERSTHASPLLVAVDAVKTIAKAAGAIMPRLWQPRHTVWRCRCHNLLLVKRTSKAVQGGATVGGGCYLAAHGQVQTGRARYFGCAVRQAFATAVADEPDVH